MLLFIFISMRFSSYEGQLLCHFDDFKYLQIACYFSRTNFPLTNSDCFNIHKNFKDLWILKHSRYVYYAYPIPNSFRESYHKVTVLFSHSGYHLHTKICPLIKRQLLQAKNVLFLLLIISMFIKLSYFTCNLTCKGSQNVR